MKLNIGCGNKPEKGYINHDIIKHSDFVDVSFNLNKIPYPYKDNTFCKIKAINVLEHVELPFYKIMNELYRIVKDKAIIEITLPYYNSTSAHSIDHYNHNFTFEIFNFLSDKINYHKFNIKGNLLEVKPKPTRLGKIIPKIFRLKLSLIFGEIYNQIYFKIEVEK